MQTRELGDVRQKRFVSTAVFESDEDFSIHNKNAPPTQALIPSQSHKYFPFSKTIAAVVIQANACSQRGETNSPIFRRSLVNKTSGITAKESCRLRMT